MTLEQTIVYIRRSTLEWSLSPPTENLPCEFIIGPDVRVDMGLFGRLKTGWALAMDSLRILRRDPELATFPLVAGIAGLVYLVVFLGGVGLLGGGGLVGDGGIALYAVLFVLYFGSTFIASFFTAGLMHETREAFEGREPSFRGGLRAAWRNVGTLLAWAAVAATVGVVIRFIERQGRNNIAARLFAGLFSVAWSILTYFVVPVIVFEDVGIKEALTRSGQTFKETWGETAAAGFGVGLVTILFLVLGFVVGAVLFLVALSLGSVLGVVGALAAGAVVVLLAYLAGVTLGGIARTALYVYATEGKKPSEFDDVDFTRSG